MDRLLKLIKTMGPSKAVFILCNSCHPGGLILFVYGALMILENDKEIFTDDFAPVEYLVEKKFLN